MNVRGVSLSRMPNVAEAVQVMEALLMPIDGPTSADEAVLIADEESDVDDKEDICQQCGIGRLTSLFPRPVHLPYRIY
jgi:hypothetical protein